MDLDMNSVMYEPHHPAMSDLVEILCHKTGTDHTQFFQAEVAYFLGVIAGSMGVTITSPERGTVPLNVYAIGLGSSGVGKGHSVNIMESVISQFRDTFSKLTFPVHAETNMRRMAMNISNLKGTEPETEFRKLQTEFNNKGAMLFSFSSATTPAIKDLRVKLQLAGCGAMNFQMDEIGSNLENNIDPLNTYLELYDAGKTKNKLTKSTTENQRSTDLEISTPANLLMFGTSTKLFDGARVEDQFYSLLETGYARRCLYGVTENVGVRTARSAEQLYEDMLRANSSPSEQYWSKALGDLACQTKVATDVQMPRESGIMLLRYKMHCDDLVDAMSEHEPIRRAEMQHRYFKVLKMAGIYTFINGESKVSGTTLKQAIRLVEESGQSFDKLFTREQNFVRLAKFIADSGKRGCRLTHAEIVQSLSFYPTSHTGRKELMDLAVAWGINNNISITRDVISGVDFFSGESLEVADQNRLRMGWSTHIADGYQGAEVSLDQMEQFLTSDGNHWCNHFFSDGHRSDDSVEEGFNVVVFDIDGTTCLHTVHELLKDYKFLTCTTKSHTNEEHRFRLVMPINYTLEMGQETYREFMNNIFDWLPFTSDTTANQRCKKWLTNSAGITFLNEGKSVLDVIPFIPKTKSNAEWRNANKSLADLDNLDRWFATELNNGMGRNNIMIRYALMLADSGLSFNDVKAKVIGLNNASLNPLKVSELEKTVFVSVKKHFMASPSYGD